MDEPKLLNVVGLTKYYQRHPGVEDLSFDVAPAETVGLLGPNGSGKSTTLHCLTGIIEPSHGKILLEGIRHSRPEAKNVFGFLPDDLPIPSALRFSEYCSLHRRLRPNYDPGLEEELIRLVGLDHHRNKFLGDFSHGMKRKAQLVTVLSHRPRLLIMDEPMRGLDPEAAIMVSSLLDIFRKKGGGVLVATHDLLAAEKYCDRVVIMNDGSAAAVGEPSELVGAAGVGDLEELLVNVTGLTERIAQTRKNLDALSFFDAPDPQTASSR